MADRVVLDTDVLEHLSRQLRMLSYDLDDCADLVKRNIPTGDCGGNLEISALSFRLDSIECSVNGGSIRELLRAIRAFTTETGDYAYYLSEKLRRACDMINETENHISRKEINAGTPADFIYDEKRTARLDYANGNSENSSMAFPKLIAGDGTQELYDDGNVISLLIGGEMVAGAYSGLKGESGFISMKRGVYPHPSGTPGTFMNASSRLGAKGFSTDMFTNVCAVGSMAALPGMDFDWSQTGAQAGSAACVLQLAERCLYEIIDGI